jgi:hypothetical protein
MPLQSLAAAADCSAPVAHRIIVKEVSQTPPPPPIISVTHVRADENER